MHFIDRAARIRDHAARTLGLAVTSNYEAQGERSTYRVVSPKGVEVARFTVKFGTMGNTVTWTNMVAVPILAAWIVECGVEDA